MSPRVHAEVALGPAAAGTRTPPASDRAGGWTPWPTPGDTVV